MSPVRFMVAVSLIFLSAFTCNAKNDTSYFDKDWQKCTKTDAVFYRVYQLKNNHEYKIEDRFIKNNTLQMTGFFTSKDSGIKNGPFVYYDEYGFKTQVGSYDHDKQIGEWNYYYAGSNTIHVTNIYKDEKIIALTSYYESGKLRRRETHNNGEPVGKCYNEKGNEIPFTPYEIMPKPPFSINEYLQRTLRYPNKSRKGGIEGRVIVKFAIDESGSVVDAEVTNHVSEECDAEARRVVMAMPKWNPGMQDDKAVKVYFNLPISFKLTD